MTTFPTLEAIEKWLDDCDTHGFRAPPFRFAEAWPVIREARLLLADLVIDDNEWKILIEDQREKATRLSATEPTPA